MISESFTPTEADIRKMRYIARKKAAKLARGHDDIRVAAEDIEQDGWETFLITQQLNGDVSRSWLRAQSRMAEIYYKFRCGSRFGVQHIPLQGVDLTALQSLDPSVEDLVYGCELMRQFGDEFQRLRRNDKSAQMFETMILNGAPYQKTYAGRPRGDETRRRRRIRAIFQRLTAATES